MRVRKGGGGVGGPSVTHVSRKANYGLSNHICTRMSTSNQQNFLKSVMGGGGGGGGGGGRSNPCGLLLSLQTIHLVNIPTQW